MIQKLHLFILLFITLSMHAQVPRGFSLGAGINQSMLDSKDLLTDPNVSYSAGIIFNFGYHESFNYESSFIVTNSALKLDYVDNQALTVHQAKYNIQNIDMGFQFNYYIIKPDEDKIYFGPLAGVYVSYNMGQLSTRDDANEQYYLPYRLTENSLTNINKINYGVSAGLVGGYNKFRLALKYNMGLSNFLDGVETDNYSETNTYTGPTLKGKLHTVSLILYYKVF
ncbi:outer membrane beta-barrel protein [Flavobacterium artemisiae]|uniref:Outer membrane beta-barrel protein n=1 Tax=Flavobacterium artemisiae TaxID=2126556 RepID=A0ABW4HDN9_9FLAO